MEKTSGPWNPARVSHRTQPARTSLTESRIVATAYELPGTALNRLVQFLKYHIWGPSSAFVTCPSAMQDGAAAVIKSQLSEHASLYDERAKLFLADALLRLSSRNPKIAWTSGQWMTERRGGSDVSNTETLATHIGEYSQDEYTTTIDNRRLPLGPWRIDGFKWFSSATDCGMAVLLARTSKGISCFAAPTRFCWQSNGIESTRLNGIRIQRLKNKLGTRAVPTAEVELNNMRGYLIGEEGKGVKVISTMLNVTRVHNAVGAAAGFGRGLAIVRAYSKVRQVAGGHLLKDIPLFRRTIAAQALECRSSTLLAFLTVLLLGMKEHPSPFQLSSIPTIPAVHVSPLLRVLTPLTKAHTAKSSIVGLQECMESLGGVGYLENTENQEFNIARLFRDANVLSIWEGTTDVLGTDLVKVMKGRDQNAVMDAIESWVRSVQNAVSAKNTVETDHGPLPNLKPYDQWLEGASIQADALKTIISTEHKVFLASASDIIVSAWASFKHWLQSTSTEDILADGRKVQRDIGSIFCAGMLVLDALRDGDIVALEACRRYIEKYFNGSVAELSIVSGSSRSELDALIAFGQDLVDIGNPVAKL